MAEPAKETQNRILILLALAVLSSTSCSRVLLDERFHSAELRNWVVIDEADTLEGPSEWRVEKDEWLHQRSNIWGPRGDFIGRWRGTLLITGDEAWTDYLLIAKAKPEDNDGFGVVFRFVDQEHFYRLLLIEDRMNGGPVTKLDKRIGPEYTEIWSAAQGYVPGKELDIEVELEGDVIRASINGNRLFELKDGSYRRGKAGLFCYAQAGQAFDEVRVLKR